jgi:hypothetical protein
MNHFMQRIVSCARLALPVATVTLLTSIGGVAIAQWKVKPSKQPKLQWYTGTSDSGKIVASMKTEPRGRNLQIGGEVWIGRDQFALSGTYYGATGQFACVAKPKPGNQSALQVELSVDGYPNTEGYELILQGGLQPLSIMCKKVDKQPNLAAVQRSRGYDPTKKEPPLVTREPQYIWKLKKPDIAPNKKERYETYTYTGTSVVYDLNKRDANGALLTQCNATWTFTGIPQELRADQDIAITIEGSISRGGPELPAVRMSAYCQGEGLSPEEVEPAVMGATQGVFKPADVGSYRFKMFNPYQAPQTIRIILGGDFGVGFIAAYTYERVNLSPDDSAAPPPAGTRPRDGLPPDDIVRDVQREFDRAIDKIKNQARAGKPAGGPAGKPTGAGGTQPQPPKSDPSGPITRVISVKGKVEAQIDGGKWVPFTPGMKLPYGSKINTGWNSEFVCERDNGITLRLDSLSLVMFKEKGVILQVGRLKSQVKIPGGQERDFEVKAPTATAGVRGTVFTVDYDEETKSTLISVEEGTVWVTPENKKLRAVTLTAGKQVIVDSENVSRIMAAGTRIPGRGPDRGAK